ERRRDTSAPQSVRRAPALTGSTLAGGTVDLAALRGQVVVVDFWASWCGPCRAAMPGLQALADEFAAAGVVVIGVSVDEQVEDAQDFAEAMQVTFPLVVDADHTLADAWQPPKMPTTYVIDADGMLVATFSGYSPGEHDTLRELVRRLATDNDASR
ncbi:MAG: TlpA family protein disulfide reductase, partial [Nannocystaceae bacterium]|nr:TlpA family protein disulfide reductase [Nannocystaceae bacterium]